MTPVLVPVDMRPARPAPRRGKDQAAAIPWAELHCHSSYSFLDGVATPAELVAEAARLGLEVLALTDHDGMYGVPQFAQAAARLRETGVALGTVFGAELSVPGGYGGAGGPPQPPPPPPPPPPCASASGGPPPRTNTAIICWSWPGIRKATPGCARRSAPPSWRAGRRGIRSTTPTRWPARTAATGWC